MLTMYIWSSHVIRKKTGTFPSCVSAAVRILVPARTGVWCNCRYFTGCNPRVRGIKFLLCVPLFGDDIVHYYYSSPALISFYCSLRYKTGSFCLACCLSAKLRRIGLLTHKISFVGEDTRQRARCFELRAVPRNYISTSG